MYVHCHPKPRMQFARTWHLSVFLVNVGNSKVCPHQRPTCGILLIDCTQKYLSNKTSLCVVLVVVRLRVRKVFLWIGCTQRCLSYKANVLVVFVFNLIAWYAVKIFVLYFQCIQNASVTRLIFERHMARSAVDGRLPAKVQDVLELCFNLVKWQICPWQVSRHEHLGYFETKLY